MGQITIYLDAETERKMKMATRSARMSRSKWIAGLIEERLAGEWPLEVVELAGAWPDLPSAEELRAGAGEDASREEL